MDASGLVQFVQQVRLDVEGIGDPVVRKVVHQVFDLVEDVVQHNQRLRDENARLGTENARLRELLQKAGVKPPPSPPPATNATGPSDDPAHAAGSATGNTAETSAADAPASQRSKDHSSEKERRAREPRSPRADGRSFRPIRVDRDVICPVDPARLPGDAVVSCEMLAGWRSPRSGSWDARG